MELEVMWKLSTAVILLSYLIGSFPTGYIVGKIAGMDVREQGSGNIGKGGEGHWSRDGYRRCVSSANGRYHLRNFSPRTFARW